MEMILFMEWELCQQTPGYFSTKPIPRIDVTSEQIALLVKINISYYKPSESNRMASCVYSNLRKMNYKDVDCSFMVNLLLKVSWPLRSPMPWWSGYMQMVQEGSYPDVYRHFKAGHHVLRRTDRVWSGLSTDLTIEQILMRSVKSSRGLTRGRGKGESQRAQRILSMPACADYNSAMQELTGVGYCTSNQHKEATHARKERDRVDTLAILEYFSERNPFTNDVSLRNIETGVEAEPDVNVDKAESIGNKTLEQMKAQKVLSYSFKKSKQSITLAAKVKVRFRLSKY
ncbi:unnamed protein product [Mytilus coruscus]|uniref:Uncharacterized protein n=1 Tax=Mytilus coruscus TaxID=42192 RepID=A0A6J8A1A0_MYTCO|nr:unnamed protein product [Mytilus coruscus]